MIPEVHRHLLDGVTVLRADSPGGASGAMLIFRVGKFDETLPASGITHLVEHLTLAGPDQPTYPFNAEVRSRFTTFYMESSAASDVADFVARICRGLAADHSSRLEQERLVLRTEAASRGGSGARGSCLIERYGATGPGLAGYQEYGLRGLAWADVAAWRERWFVAGNAVLCVLGEMPAGLRIELPPGPAPETPALHPCDVQLPCFMITGRGGIGMSLAGPGFLASAVALDVLQQRLSRELRHDRGLSYNVQLAAEPLDAGLLRHVWLAADALPEQAPMAADVMLGTFEKLAEGGATAEEIAGYARHRQDIYASPAGPTVVMRVHAENILTGRPVREPTETLRLAGELTGDAIAASAAGLYASMIVATPWRLPAVQGRMPQLPRYSATVLEGVSFRSRTSAATLTIGERGVMLTPEPGRFVTVPSDRVAAVLRWNDATLTLIGTDGFRVQLDPSEWDGADNAIRAVAARTDPELIVPIDSPGPAGAKPAAAAAAAAAAPARAKRFRRRRGKAP